MDNQYKVTFLNSVFLFAGVIAFVMAFVRWQTSPLMGGIDFVFSASCIALIVYLKSHRHNVETISNIAIVLAYVLFTSLYLLATDNASRIALFFLLLASVVFLKGLKAGRYWLIIIVTTIVVPVLLYREAIHYSLLDIATASIYLTVFFIIFNHYETVRLSYAAKLEDLNKDLSLKVERRTQQLEITNAALEKEKAYLEHASSHDALTGVMNRFKFEEIFDFEIKQSIRHRYCLSIILLDIDHFKKINDQHGHNQGDIVLQELATVLLTSTRESDLVVRWGGEEFILLLPQTDLHDAGLLAEKCRHNIKQNDSLKSYNITASFGVTTTQDEISLGTFVHQADTALYEAKDAGRDRVELALHKPQT